MAFNQEGKTNRETRRAWTIPIAWLDSSVSDCHSHLLPTSKKPSPFISIARLGPILMLAVRIFAPLPLRHHFFFLTHGRHSPFKFLLLSMSYPKDAGWPRCSSLGTRSKHPLSLFCARASYSPAAVVLKHSYLFSTQSTLHLLLPGLLLPLYTHILVVLLPPTSSSPIIGV
jgi:hypothetical protein